MKLMSSTIFFVSHWFDAFCTKQAPRKIICLLCLSPYAFVWKREDYRIWLDSGILHALQALETELWYKQDKYQTIFAFFAFMTLFMDLKNVIRFSQYESLLENMYFWHEMSNLKNWFVFNLNSQDFWKGFETENPNALMSKHW